MARKNLVAGEAPFFLGCGAYRHHVPASVDHIIQRGERDTSNWKWLSRWSRLQK